MYAHARPEIVIHLAAVVGGIGAIRQVREDSLLFMTDSPRLTACGCPIESDCGRERGYSPGRGGIAT
jgi:hypothetical protein